MELLFDGILFEDQCIRCGKIRVSSDIPLCSRCVSLLRPAVNVFKNASDNRVYYMCRYNDVSGVLIKSFKYNAFIESGIFMSAIMSTGIETLTDGALLTYIPFDRIRQYNRFFNHAEVLARTIAYITGLRSCNILKKGVNIVSQARLPSFLRRNRHIRFTAERKTVERIIVIDDVVTSGNTMNGAINALKKANPDTEIMGLCFAGH